MADPEAVVYAAVIGAVAALFGSVVGGLVTMIADSRRQKREERHRIASERRAAYADLSKELRRLIPVNRPRPYVSEPIPDLDPLESARARVTTLGSPAVSKAADKAYGDVFVFRKALSQMGFLKRAKFDLEGKARTSVHAYEKTCRDEANRAK